LVLCLQILVIYVLFFEVRDHAPHLHKATVFYILILEILESRWPDKSF